MNDKEIGDLNKNLALRSVGGLLLHWGQLETKIAYNITQLAPDDTGSHIDPDSVPRSMKRVLDAWLAAYKAATVQEHKTAGDLKASILNLTTDRNAVCHGFNGMVISSKKTNIFHIVCWEKFLQKRMTGNAPKQKIYSSEEMRQMADKVRGFQIEIDKLTREALAFQEAEKT